MSCLSCVVYITCAHNGCCAVFQMMCPDRAKSEGTITPLHLRDHQYGCRSIEFAQGWKRALIPPLNFLGDSIPYQKLQKVGYKTYVSNQRNLDVFCYNLATAPKFPLHNFIVVLKYILCCNSQIECSFYNSWALKRSKYIRAQYHVSIQAEIFFLTS